MLRSVRHRLAARVSVLVVAGALVLTACSGGTDAVDQTAGGDFRYVGATSRGKTIPVADRKTAGDASAPYLDNGKTWQLSSLKGQVVVMNFWATWCSPCVVETPAFDKLYRQVKAQGIAFIGVDVKETSKSKAKSFIADNDISYPIVYDQIAKTAIQLGRVPASSLPSTVVIDRQGRVAAVYVGTVAAGDLDPVLTQLATEK